MPGCLVVAEWTVLLAPTPVLLLPRSTVEEAPVPQVTAVPSAAVVAKVIISPAPAVDQLRAVRANFQSQPKKLKYSPTCVKEKS
jgi:hypothetical protein